jgi:hypothetical protein
MSDLERKEGYSTPLPEVVPRGTWWPAAVALFATSLAGWIGEIRHERKAA